MTHDQSMARMHVHIDSGSWALQGVEVDQHQRPWAYTIGLMQNFRHPELVITDGDWQDSALILNVVGEWVRAGDRFAPGMVVELDGDTIEFGVVDPSYTARGLCASFSAYCDWAGSDPGPLELLQVITASSSYCGNHEEMRRSLALPEAFAMAGSGPNRMERRRTARRRR